VRLVRASKEIAMDERKGGIVFSLFCLATSGAGDDAASFQTYVLSGAIVLGSSMVSLALLRGRKEE